MFWQIAGDVNRAPEIFDKGNKSRVQNRLNQSSRYLFVIS